MFSGIVQLMGRVAKLTPNDFGTRLLIDPGNWDYHPPAGDSIAVNGCCLTNAPHAGDPPGLLCFDVIKETLDVTNLGRLRAGSPVNLEPSLSAATPIAGHFVQGHIDGTGTVTHVKTGKDEVRITVSPVARLWPYIIPKGSIALDGVSLTIASVDMQERIFDVALIPTTLDITTLGQAKVGDILNLESDMIARTVVHWLKLQQAGQGTTIDKATLRAAGLAD